MTMGAIASDPILIVVRSRARWTVPSGGFSGPTRPQKAKDLTRRNPKAQGVQRRGRLRRIAITQLVNVNHRPSIPSAPASAISLSNDYALVQMTSAQQRLSQPAASFNQLLPMLDKAGCRRTIHNVVVEAHGDAQVFADGDLAPHDARFGGDAAQGEL